MRSSFELRSKAIHLPSGENRGALSRPMPVVSCVSFPVPKS